MTSQNSDVTTSPFGKLAADAVRPLPAAPVDVEVSMDLTNRVLAAYIEELFGELESALMMYTAQQSMPFSQLELFDYCVILVEQRINWVLSTRNQFLKPTDQFVVPSYLHLLLAQIGTIDALQFGVFLKPKVLSGVTSRRDGDSYLWTFDDGFNGAGPRERTKSWFYNLSRRLQGWSRFGFEYGIGYDRIKTGSFEFMSMHLVQNHVMHHTDSAHPVYAVMAATLALTVAEQPLMPRVDYGDIDVIKHVVRAFAKPKSAFVSE